MSETGYYHVVTRGNRRQAVFQEAADYQTYCGLLEEAIKAHDIQLAHFCLMPNHVHLLAYAPEIKRLSQTMHQLQRRYWFYYRRQYKLTGHLWQGRYHSFPIETEAYLLEASRYIERNPLEAKLVDKLENYSWSSYPSYAYQRLSPVTLVTSNGYDALGNTAKSRQEAYRRFVETPQPYDKTMRRKLQLVTTYA